MTSLLYRLDRPDTATVPGRGRSLAALFATAALVNAAMTVAGTAGTLTFADSVGAGWAGLPNAIGVAGTAGGVALLTRLMTRHGRRSGLLVGAVTGVAGAALAAVGVGTAAPVPLVAGMLLLGIGNAAAQLCRYAAADLYPAARRGTVLGALVWAGTIGAVGGPLLMAPTGRVAGALHLPALTGPLLLAAVSMTGALVATLALVPRPVPPAEERSLAAAWSVWVLLRRPAVRLALAAMATAQVVMAAIMTAAPLHMHMHGHGLGLIGLVLGTHTLGMFALAPLSGWLTDRFGGRRVIGAGLVTLALSAVLVVNTATAGWPGLPVSLFLLGYGWNLAIVAGSALLSAGLPEAVRPRAQGLVEALFWTGGALATLASTGILGAAGYPALAAGTGALVLIPAALLLFGRK